MRHSLTDTAVTAVDPVQFPLIAADLAYIRGMAHRQLGDEEKAQIWLSKATINGALIEPAKQALADKFDLRDFNDAVLETGSVPLETLERHIDAWIAARR